MSRKITTEMVKKEYQERGFEFMDDEYISVKTKYHIKCLKCNRVFLQEYHSFHIGRGCQYCAGNIKLELNFIIEEYFKHNLKFLDNFYNNNHEFHNIECLVCGHIWLQTYNVLQSGCGCPKCKPNRAKQTNLKRWGVENPAKTEKIQKKMRQSCFKNFGVEYSMQNKLVRDKAKKTNLEKYGVESPLQSKEIALKAARSSNNSVIKYHWFTGEELVCIAGYEPKVIDYLNDNKIDFLWQPQVFPLADGKHTYRPDLYLIKQELWVEIKGYMRPGALIKWEEFHNIIKPNSELWDKNKLKEMGIL